MGIIYWTWNFYIIYGIFNVNVFDNSFKRCIKEDNNIDINFKEKLKYKSELNIL